MKKIFLVICFLFLIAGCNSNETNNEMTISLKGNATTGYEWDCEVADVKVLEQKNNDYVVDSNSEDMVGQPGIYKLTFKAIKEGSTDVICSYQRSWEQEEPIYQLTYKVKVDQDLNIEFESVDGTYSETELPKPSIGNTN